MAAAVAAAVAAGGIGAVGALIGRKPRENETSFLDAQLARGGVLLWVRTPASDTERRTLEVLRRHATHVHLHDLPADFPLGQHPTGAPPLRS